jgi:hypothetical protein
MGGVNQRSAVASNSITVNFPAPGVYPYEVDYAKGGDKNITLTMLARGAPIPPASADFEPGADDAQSSGSSRDIERLRVSV